MIFMVLLVAFLAVLTAGGVMLVVRSRRRGSVHEYPACGKCGYDVTATVGGTGRCPECGSALIEVGVLAPRGKAGRDRLMLWMGIGMLVLVAGCVGTTIVNGLVMTYHMQRRVAAAQQQAVAKQQAIAAQQQQQQQQAASLPPAETPDKTEGDEE